MKIYSLKIENFLSFKDYFRVFENEEVISIIGKNLSGKSSLMEAIDYAITGHTRAAKEIQMIHHGTDYMKVELVLIDDGIKRKIVRGRDIKNNGILEFDSYSKVKEAQEAIYEYIGVNDKELKMTSFFNMNNASMFMDLPSADKKKHLMNWLQNNHWIKLKEAVDLDLSDQKRNLDKLQGELVALSSSIQVLNITKDTYLANTTRLDILNKSLISAKDKHLKYVSRAGEYLFKLNSMEKVINNLLEKIQINEHETEKINEQKEQHSIVAKKLENALLKIKDKNEDETYKSIKLVNKKIMDLKIALRDKTREFKLLNNNDHNGICPILKTVCDRIQIDINKIGEVKKDIDKIKIELNSYDKKLIVLEDIVDDFKKYYKIRDRSRDLEQLNNKIKQLFDERKANITKRKTLITKAKKLKVLQDEAVIDRDKLENRVKSIEASISTLRDSVIIYKEISENNTVTNKRIDIANKKVLNISNTLVHTSYLSNAFGNNGIPSMEIENSFSEIEDEINDCLNHLNDNIRILFSPDKQLTKKDTKCVCGFVFPKGYSKKTCTECDRERTYARKDELSIEIVENDEKINFSQLSSGGKIIVSLSVRIALMRLLHRRYNCNFSTLFFDEIDGPLDDTHIRKVRSFVKNILINKFKYSQIFWVSHNDMLKNNASTTLEISKVDGVSRVREL